MLKHYFSEENQRKRHERAKKGAKARWANHHKEQEEIKSLPDPLYLLAFEDFTTGLKHIWTIHDKGNTNSFRVFENGQEIPETGFSEVLVSLRKKRVRIESIRNL